MIIVIMISLRLAGWPSGAPTAARRGIDEKPLHTCIHIYVYLFICLYYYYHEHY